MSGGGQEELAERRKAESPPRLHLLRAQLSPRARTRLMASLVPYMYGSAGAAELGVNSTPFEGASPLSHVLPECGELFESRVSQ